MFLLYYAHLGSLMPYLPVYYHSLGLPGKLIGKLGAITPATTFIVGPLWGAFCDKSGKHRDVMLFTFVSAVLARGAICARNDVSWMMPMVFITAVLNAPVRPLLDASVMNLLDDPNAYGRYGASGSGLHIYGS